MLNSIYITGKSFSELMALFFAEMAHDDDYYDVIAYHLAVDHREQLEAILCKLDVVRLRAALCGLGMSESASSEELIRPYLHHEEALVVASAIDALRRMQLTAWEDIAHHLRHPSPFVRGAALRFAKARMGQEALPILRDALHDGDPIVKQNALDELDDFSRQLNPKEILPLVDDPSTDVRKAATWLLKSIANEPHF